MNLVDSILGSAAELPPFPAVIQRVLLLMDNPKSSAREVVEVIQYDQAITANVLRVCNSAYFSLRRPVHSLREALVRIGFNQLLEIVLNRGSAHLLAGVCPGYDLKDGELWRHSVTCALLSQIISKRLGQEPTPTHFTAALLHDIGKVILSRFVADHFGEIRRLVQEGGRSFIAAEKEVLGIDHAELGGKISEQWQFPKMIGSAIRYHHDPLRIGEDSEMLQLIYLCDLVSMLTGIGGGADGLSYHGHKEVMKSHHLSGQDIEQFIDQLEGRLKQVENVLTLQ
jgi:putative nucleotidyltransferase with HDIG domain